MQPISNGWIDEVKRLRAENSDLRLNLFVIRMAWLTYGVFAGFGLAALLYAAVRG